MNEELQREIDRLWESILQHDREIADVWKYMGTCIEELNKLVDILKENMF